MENEYHKLAEDIKAFMRKSGNHAVADASGSKGVIESVNPLIITTYEGAIRYEEAEDEIIKSKLFAGRTKKKGDEVIVVPIESLDMIAVIDLIE